MKKLLILAAVFFLGIMKCYAAGEIDLRFSVDFSQKYELDLGDSAGSDNPGTGFSAAAEYKIAVIDKIKLGIGAEYMFPREEFSFLPVYAIMQVNVFNKDDNNVYMKMNIGGSVLYQDDERYTGERRGGLYYALGIGCELRSGFIFELGYARYAGSGTEYATSNNGTYDVEVSKPYFQVGYKFKL